MYTSLCSVNIYILMVIGGGCVMCTGWGKGKGGGMWLFRERVLWQYDFSILSTCANL